MTTVTKYKVLVWYRDGFGNERSREYIGLTLDEAQAKKNWALHSGNFSRPEVQVVKEKS